MRPQSVDEVAHRVRQFYEACSAERLFERHDPGRGIDHALAQAGWILTQGREGDFFIILIGRRT